MNNNAKYAFYYLLSLVALIFTALSVGMIIFGIIDQTVVDALNIGSSQGQFKFAISALFIAAPIFYTTMSLINKGLRNKELDRDSGVRRWLTYLIILVASLIILGVLIGVINNFLSGALTMGFVLKMLSMIIIAALTFSFYLHDIKREEFTKKDKVASIFFFLTLAIVVISFIAVWFFVESPKLARDKSLDERLMNNIYSVENAVNTFYSNNSFLPDNIEQIKSSQDVFLNKQSLVDPQTSVPIVYNKTGEKSFEICATFRTSSDQEDVYSRYNDKKHDAGYQCVKGNLWQEGTPTKF